LFKYKLAIIPVIAGCRVLGLLIFFCRFNT
jgi:hypothetical protein